MSEHISDLGAKLKALDPHLATGNGHPRKAPVRPPSTAAPARGDQHWSEPLIDWALVRSWRQQAAEHLTRQIRDRDGLTDEERRALELDIVTQIVREHNDDGLRAGRAPVPAPELEAYTRALLDSMPPRLGRMQPLVDDPEIESIRINGCDNVEVVYADGTRRFAAPVADSDEELLSDLRFIATHAADGERPFSRANWSLHLNLPGGARLAATAWASERPQVVIRRHRLIEVTLDDLVSNGSMTSDCAQFLRAAVRANKSIVVSGSQGHGKTTLVRALLGAIAPGERFGTIETEYELYAHRWATRQRNTPAWEARPGSGERSADGSSAGEITLDELIYTALRMDLSRIIVGEVRGKEVLAMFKAMQVGPGSISTLHARHARAVVERLVSLAVEAGNHVETFAYRQIAEHIDLIVHVTMDEAGPNNTRRRYVSEVLLVEPGEGGRPALTDIYRPGPTGPATYVGCPADFLGDLQTAGLSPTFGGGAGWGT